MANEPRSIFEEDTRPKKDLRVLAAVCYFPIGFALPHFLWKGEEPFVAFHVRQGAAFFVVAFFLSFVIGPLAWLAYFVFSGITGYHAYQWDRYMTGLVKWVIELVNKKEDSKEDETKK